MLMRRLYFLFIFFPRHSCKLTSNKEHMLTTFLLIWKHLYFTFLCPLSATYATNNRTLCATTTLRMYVHSRGIFLTKYSEKGIGILTDRLPKPNLLRIRDSITTKPATTHNTKYNNLAGIHSTNYRSFPYIAPPNRAPPWGSIRFIFQIEPHGAVFGSKTLNQRG